MTGPSETAIRRQLNDLGAPSEFVERAVATAAGAYVPTCSTRRRDATTTQPAMAPAPAGPVTIVLPWSALASDNERHTRLGAHSKRYVAARTRAHDLAVEQWGERAPFAGRVRLSVLFFPPNAQRRDPSNLLKLLHDALEGVAYVNDCQIDDEHWQRMAPDVDRPRAEVIVEEIC